jgi:hypothetical protein
VVAVMVGWVAMAMLLTVGFTERPSIVGAAVSIAVLVYLGWSYPVSCAVTPDSVTIQSPFRQRTISWSSVIGVRRTKGAWRRSEVGAKTRIRPAPGAIVLVLSPRRTVLMLGHAESRADNMLLVEVVGSSSPALADSLRLGPRNGE